MELKGTAKFKKRTPEGLVYELKIPGANFMLVRVEGEDLADEGKVTISIPSAEPEDAPKAAVKKRK